MGNPALRHRTPRWKKLTLSTVRTGEHCPLTGWWTSDGAYQALPVTVFVSQGSLMPAVLGQVAVWTLT